MIPVECLHVEQIGKIGNMYVLPAHTLSIGNIDEYLIDDEALADIFYNLEIDDFRKLKSICDFIGRYIIKDKSTYQRLSNCTFIVIERDDCFDLQNEENRIKLAENGIFIAQLVKPLLSFFILKDSDFKYTKYLPCRPGTTPFGERIYYIQDKYDIELHPDLRSGIVKGFGIAYTYHTTDLDSKLYKHIFPHELNEVSGLIQSTLIMLVDSYYIEDRGLVYIFLMRIFEKLANPNKYIEFSRVKSKLLPGLTFAFHQNENFPTKTIEQKNFKKRYHELSDKLDHFQKIRSDLTHTGKSPFQSDEKLFIEDVQMMILFIQKYIDYLYYKNFKTIEDRDCYNTTIRTTYNF